MYYGKQPYKFNLSKFCESIDLTEEEAYKNFYWVKDVVKADPIIWFYPEERNSNDTTVSNSENFFLLPFNLMYSKHWCDQIAIDETSSEKTERLKEWMREEELSPEIVKKVVDKIIELDWGSLRDLQKILDESVDKASTKR